MAARWKEWAGRLARPGGASCAGRALLLAGALALPVAPVFLPTPAPLPQGVEIAPEALRRLLLLALLQSLALAFLALACARFDGRGLRAGLGLRRGRLGPADVGLLILGMAALSHGLDHALALAAPEPGASLSLLNELLRAARDGGGEAVALAVLAIGIAPGVCEELLFRGALQRWLQRKLAAQGARGAAGLAVVCSAAVFGALHWDPIHAPLAFLLGLYLGAAALLSGEVWTPIACHMANNLLAVAAGLWLPSALSAAAPPAESASALAAACSFLLCIACLVWVMRRARPTNR